MRVEVDLRAEDGYDALGVLPMAGKRARLSYFLCAWSLLLRKLFKTLSKFASFLTSLIKFMTLSCIAVIFVLLGLEKSANCSIHFIFSTTHLFSVISLSFYVLERQEARRCSSVLKESRAPTNAWLFIIFWLWRVLVAIFFSFSPINWKLLLRSTVDSYSSASFVFRAALHRQLSYANQNFHPSSTRGRTKLPPCATFRSPYRRNQFACCRQQDEHHLQILLIRPPFCSFVLLTQLNCSQERSCASSQISIRNLLG